MKHSNTQIEYTIKHKKKKYTINIGLIIVVMITSAVTWFLTEYLVYELNQMDIATTEWLNQARPKAHAATESIAIIREDCTQASDLTLNCYNSLFDWEAAENRDLTATDEIAVAQIKGAWVNPDTTAVVIAGWITSATNYIKIYTTADARHSGKWDTNKYILTSALTKVLTVSEEFTRIDGLQINHQAGEAGIITSSIYYDADIRISNNIIKGYSGAGTHHGIFLYQHGDNGSATKIWNNIIYGESGDGGKAITTETTRAINTSVYNNTILNCTTGITKAGLVVFTAKNNIIQSTTDGYVGTFDSSSDYNISDIDTDAPNATFTGGYATIIFTDSANNDFHLSSSDTSAKDAGTDLSTDANLSFTTDIDGETRSAPWDIGADEAGGTAPTPDTEVPSIPANLTATAISSSQIDLSWDASADDTGVTGYRIYRDSVEITTVTGTTYSDTGLTAETTYSYTVSAYDAVPNESDQSTPPVSATTEAIPPPDETNPAISNIQTSNITSSSATITWTTDESATSQAEYGTDTNYGTITILDSTLTTSHSVTISGLTESTTYYYRVRSKDSFDNEAISGGYSFDTTAFTGNIYYIDWVDGADTNDGITKSTPWKRAPGMRGCQVGDGDTNGNCNIKRKAGGVAGDQFIFKGGVTWPKETLSFDWYFGSGTEANSIYFGVDKTWHTGETWARPIFDAEGTEPTASPEGQTIMMRAYGSWIIVDNIEFTGVAQLHGGDNGYAAGMLSISPSSSHDGGEVKNCYFHGWSHGPTTAGVWDEGEDQGGIAGDNSIILTSALISESPNFNLKIHDNAWDGSDTTGDMAMAYKGSAGHFYNNYITKMTNGIVTTGGRYYWGNTFKDIARDDTETGCPLRQPTNFSFGCTTHGNSIESMNTQSIIYNNLFQNVGGGVIIWTQPKLNVVDYVFNNVIVDASSIGIQISATSLIEGNSAGFYVFNNLIQGETNAARITGPAEAVYISFGTMRNNHLIGIGAGISFNHTTTQTDGNNIVMTDAEATSAGYVASSIYSPPAGGVTVDAGYDLTTFCSGVPSSSPSLASTACLSDTTAGVSYNVVNHTVSYPYRTVVERDAWDTGAYEFTGTQLVSPAAPENLKVVE